jgi:hypothetical protein
MLNARAISTNKLKMINKCKNITNFPRASSETDSKMREKQVHPQAEKQTTSPTDSRPLQTKLETHTTPASTGPVLLLNLTNEEPQSP